MKYIQTPIGSGLYVVTADISESILTRLWTWNTDLSEFAEVSAVQERKQTEYLRHSIFHLNSFVPSPGPNKLSFIRPCLIGVAVVWYSKRFCFCSVTEDSAVVRGSKVIISVFVGFFLWLGGWPLTCCMWWRHGRGLCLWCVRICVGVTLCRLQRLSLTHSLTHTHTHSHAYFHLSIELRQLQSPAY
jgi:hypothetical protein